MGTAIGVHADIGEIGAETILHLSPQRFGQPSAPAFQQPSILPYPSATTIEPTHTTGSMLAPTHSPT